MEHFVIDARPQPFDVIPYFFTLNNFINTVPSIVISGRSFNKITNIYLSSNNINLFSLSSIYINPFLTVPKLSTEFLGFSGLDVTEYAVVVSSNYITLNLPNIFINSGYFDVIIQNEAGFGILSHDCIVPLVSSWVGATNIQKPCISGIQVSII